MFGRVCNTRMFVLDWIVFPEASLALSGLSEPTDPIRWPMMEAHECGEAK